MSRKFRLSVHRKNEFRKRHAECVAASNQEDDHTLPVSIPLESVSVLKVSLPREMYLEAPISTISQLQRRLKALPVLPQGWIEVTAEMSTGEMFFSKVEERGDGAPQLACGLVVHQDFFWHVHVKEQKLTTCSPPLSTMPQVISSVADVGDILEFINSCVTCSGNNDDKYAPLIASRKGNFMNASGTKRMAFYDMGDATVRCDNCELLVPQQSESVGVVMRCGKCNEYRKTLNRMLFRIESSKGNNPDKCHPQSHTNYRFLNTPEKDKRLQRLHQQSRINQQRAERLKVRLERATELRGTVVGEDLHGDLKQIMEENSPFIAESYPQESFARSFWESQQRASSLKDARSMRWDPLVIRWCLYLRHLSGSAYEMLRESGVIKLPSQRTLRDYTYYTKATTGFSDEVDRQLMEAAKIHTCPEREKYVITTMDEMHIREDIVYDKHTGSVVGFTNLGDINSHLLAFERLMRDDEAERSPLANSMLVLLVRGLFSRLEFPYVQFPCTALSGDKMYDPFWEAVGRLELCGFKVLALTCDGLAANRRLFRLHDPGSKSIVYKVANPYAADGRHLYFLGDPPHLIKTVRNGWASKKRHLWCNGKEISWSHLVNLYWRNRSQETPGLALLPKLKYEHIELSSYSKMRVDLAAQVLSSSVANALQLTRGEEVEETVKFVANFDKFFDSLNVSSLSAGKLKRNAFKSPYRSATDFRLKWLEEEFIPYLDSWERSVQDREGFSKAEKLTMLLSAETRLGLRITVHSFVEMVKYIFTIPGVTLFLSNRICQDPLEKFFGQQRQRGRTNENPNAHEFMKNTQALRVINCTCGTIRGNCRGSAHEERVKKRTLEVENTPLPKRKTKHK